MYLRQGSAHVDERSQWVYKLKIPYYSGGNRKLLPIMLYIDRKAAKQIVDILLNDKNHEIPIDYVFDIRSRMITINRKMIEAEVEGNVWVNTDHHWYNGGDECKEYRLDLEDDWGMSSWQRLLVNLKCWIG
jgi:hypothetical protein